MNTDMRRVYNYYALALTVLNPNFSPEQAILYFSPPANQKQNERMKKAEIEDMVLLKQEMTYPQLAEIFHRNPSVICRMIKAFQRTHKPQEEQ